MFTVIQIIFAEQFVTQDFTIRAAPGLSGPTNTCATIYVPNVEIVVYTLKISKK